MHRNDVPHRVLIALFTAAIVCTGLTSWLGWQSSWLLDTLSLKPIFCCMPFAQSAAMTAMPFGIRLQFIFGTALLVIGLWTTMRYFYYTAQRTKQLLSASQVAQPPHLIGLLAELGLDPHVVFVKATQPLAFCFGFLRPRICLSTGLVERLSSTQIKAVLLHEDHHRRHFDPLRLLLAEAACRMLFFLPVVREWRAIFRIDLELEADRYAISRVGKAALAGALYRLLASASVPPSVHGTMTTALSSDACRMAALLGEHPTPHRVSARSLLHSTGVICLLCLLARL